MKEKQKIEVFGTWLLMTDMNHVMVFSFYPCYLEEAIKQAIEEWDLDDRFTFVETTIEL